MEGISINFQTQLSNELNSKEEKYSISDFFSKLTGFQNSLSDTEKKLFILILKAIDHSLFLEKSVDLGKQLFIFSNDLDNSEVELFKHLISLAASGLEKVNWTEESFTQEQAILSLVHSIIPSTGKFGIIFYGYTKFLDEIVLSSLAAEARILRASAPRRTQGTGCSAFGGEVSNNIAKLLVDYINQLSDSDKFILDGKPIYLYYDNLGDGIESHVDRGEFTVNALICVSHTAKQEFTSSTYVYGVDGRKNKFMIKPGQVLIFDSGYLLHGRTQISIGEAVTILSIGLKRQITPPD